MNTIDNTDNTTVQEQSCGRAGDIIRLGILPLGGTMAIVGDMGVGLSWLAQESAFELSTGRPWLGCFPTRRVKVLYLEQQYRSSAFRSRFLTSDWQREYPEAGKWLAYHDETKLDLDTIEGVHELAGMISEFGAGILIVDDFTSTCGKEDPDNLRLTLDNYRIVIRDTGAAMIFVQSIMGGSSVSNFLKQEVDTIIRVSRSSNRQRELTLMNDRLYPVTLLPLTFDFKPGTAVPYNLA